MIEITEECGLLQHLLPGKIYTGRYKYNGIANFVGDKFFGVSR